MLARLSIGKHEALHVSSRSVDGEQLTVNVDLLLRDIAFHIPDTWRCAALLYSKFYPTYQNIQNLLSDDLKCMEKLFADLEEIASELEDDELDILSADDEDTFEYSDDSFNESSYSLSTSSPPHPHTIPKIIITPCTNKATGMMCRVPLQDSAYNHRLTVPSHTTVNHSFPPMRSRAPSILSIRNWAYRDGHWQAVLPGLEEQFRKGLFSRPTNARRRASRRPPSAVLQNCT